METTHRASRPSLAGGDGSHAPPGQRGGLPPRDPSLPPESVLAPPGTSRYRGQISPENWSLVEARIAAHADRVQRHLERIERNLEEANR